MLGLRSKPISISFLENEELDASDFDIQHIQALSCVKALEQIVAQGQSASSLLQGETQKRITIIIASPLVKSQRFVEMARNDVVRVVRDDNMLTVSSGA